MGLNVGMDLGTLGPYADAPPDTTLPVRINHGAIGGFGAGTRAVSLPLVGIQAARALLPVPVGSPDQAAKASRAAAGRMECC